MTQSVATACDVLQQVWRVDLLFRLAALRVDQRRLGVVSRAQDDLISQGRGLRLATIQRVPWRREGVVLPRKKQPFMCNVRARVREPSAACLAYSVTQLTVFLEGLDEQHVRVTARFDVKRERMV